MSAGETTAKRVNGLVGALRMLAPRWRWLAAATVTIVLFTGASLAKPLAIQYGLDHGVADGDGRALAMAGAAFLGLLVTAALFQGASTYLVNRVGQDFLFDLRMRLFTHYQRMSLAFFGRENAGRLVSRMTSDVTTVNDVLNNGFLVVVQSLLTLVGATVILVTLSVQLSLAVALILPPLVVATAIFRVYSNRAYGSVRERIADVMVHMQETFSGCAWCRPSGGSRRTGSGSGRSTSGTSRRTSTR